MKISESESRVMEVLWQESPLQSGDIVSRVAPACGWSPKTVRTLIDRLVDKGALERDGEGRHYRYRPLLSRQEWLHGQTGSLVDAHCDGRLAPLVAAFVEAEAISDEDRREILDLLERLK
jgi:predicted transcriptional regulator